MDKSISKAINIAKAEIRKIVPDFKIDSVLDLGNSYLVNWSATDGILSDNFGIEIDKRTFNPSVFLLPNKENFKRLKKAVTLYEWE